MALLCEMVKVFWAENITFSNIKNEFLRHLSLYGYTRYLFANTNWTRFGVYREVRMWDSLFCTTFSSALLTKWVRIVSAYRLFLWVNVYIWWYKLIAPTTHNIDWCHNFVLLAFCDTYGDCRCIVFFMKPHGWFFANEIELKY